jgi:immune inhibitor A
MTLTRTFDLTGLSQAHLRVSLWYDIEDGWDYAYIEASSDGGKTWRLLPGLHSKVENPTGQSYGPAYTGRSTGEGSSSTAWLEESIDLSEFTGREVVVRFEYITDVAVNQAGLCIDDIRISELGYSHDAENGDDGWEGRGFVRVDNTIPRRYLIQTFGIDGGDLRLERTWIEGGRDTELTVVTPAVVAISDVTRLVDSPARYALTVRAQD